MTLNIAKNCQGNISRAHRAQSQPPKHATLNPLRAASQRKARVVGNPYKMILPLSLILFRVEMYTRGRDVKYISLVVNLLRLFLTCSSTIGVELCRYFWFSYNRFDVLEARKCLKWNPLKSAAYSFCTWQFACKSAVLERKDHRIS